MLLRTMLLYYLKHLINVTTLCLDALYKFRFFQKVTGNFPLSITTLYVHIDILCQQNIVFLFVIHMI